jgi:hypothetical protein
LSVRQEALGLLLLEDYREPWEQLVTYMKWGEWECHPEQCHPSQDQVHKSWTEEDAMKNWGNGAIQSATQRGVSGPTVEWRTEILDS